jgi:type IV pilus assembly protein PilB
MVVKDIIKKEEELKEQILLSEDKKAYRSERFKKIEDKVKDSLKRQSTDEALKNITVWALVLGSSDIHYEVFERYIVVRFRIDWILVDIFRLDIQEYKLVKERLKYSSSLKLNITNVPQDGKYSLDLGVVDEKSKRVDVRVSTLPIKYGENIVCRVLDSAGIVVDFEKLWFFWTSKRMLEKSLSKKNGMVLVTWPTGSGKTTTLYTMLSKINSREKKIITLEDPIEYDMDWIIQSEVEEKNGFDFKTWLKALLRQDPDIIMVWEIRDRETLETATSASLTWHLVLSTLHTKSAAETLDRIINMWLQPYILASALDTIIAQRLVRKICSHCKKEKEKTSEEVAMIETMMTEIWMSKVLSKNLKLFSWQWCNNCNNSGYSWRIWIYEIISLNEKLRDMIREGATTEEIFREARNGDLIAMKEDGILKAIKWYTTIEEILRVI